MDRLHALTLTAFTCALLACDGSGPPPPPQSSRVEAVAAKAVDDDALDEFCDVHADEGEGPRLQMPPLAPPPPGDNQVVPSDARWLNLWATWCKPCTEELPMIAQWQSRLTQAGASARVAFVSMDADDAAIEAFRKTHASTPPPLRARDAESMAQWMKGLGLDPGAGLPVHVYADAMGHVRCVRSGAITEHHYAVVEELMR